MLIEAVAALAIAILLMAFAYPLVAGGTTPPRLLALAASSAALLRDARTAAVAGGRPVAARFDAARRRLVARDAAVAIPADVDFSLTAGGNCRTGEGGAAVLFRPDGSGCGARAALRPRRPGAARARRLGGRPCRHRPGGLTARGGTRAGAASPSSRRWWRSSWRG